ncbi:MAG TPA: hypothetical protein VFK86_13110 [Bauldia sp.]|nr:hypothetical protein [Bauldia sp.]
MIVVAGIPGERPTELLIEALDEIGANYRCFDQRRHEATGLSLAISNDVGGGAIGGELVIDGERMALSDITAVFLRIMDDNLLPDIATLPPGDPRRSRCRQLHETFLRWTDISPGRVLNRPTDMASNQSKPYQAHVIREIGFSIPETLITNDPDAARDFIETVWNTGGRVIYKSISGVRSVVQTLRTDDLKRLDRIRWCPTQFQRYVAGTDIRVHVVGHSVFAARIESEATDYRYAARQSGADAVLSPTELDTTTRARCIALAERLRLPLSGIDLREMPSGDHACFEVNPSPAYSYYQDRTGHPIAAAIARYLAGESD